MYRFRWSMLLLLFIPMVMWFDQAVPAGPITSETQVSVAATRNVIDTYCLSCHNDRSVTGGLSLTGRDIGDVSADRELWEKVLLKIRTGQMPPAGRPRPDPPAAAATVAWLETALDQAAVARPLYLRKGFHRLNRTEYANAIRDLLALEIDARSMLLPDEGDDGFDNIASSLTISTTHFERYLSAARKISRLAVGDPALGEVPAFQVYPIPRLLNQDGRVDERLPFGSRGGTAVTHDFPFDGEYLIKIRLRRQIYDYIVGMGEAQPLDIRIDGRRVKRFVVGGEGENHGASAPLTYAGEIVGDIGWETYMHTADDPLEIRLPVEAGTRTVSVSFVRNLRQSESAPQPIARGFTIASDHFYDGFAAIDNIAVAGPYSPSGPGDTPSRRAIFTCRPEAGSKDEGCARTILSDLARRAYRRPVTPQEVETLLQFYRDNTDRGFEAGIQSAIERLLVSLNFLFRIESVPPNATPGTIHALNDLELASELSFFIWAGIPDEPLLEDAVRGRLKDPAVLEQQVRRMLSDPKSRALVDNFAGQWLTFRKAQAWRPDADQFPDFDENLRTAMLAETTLFIESQVREDRSILDLLRADYTYINDRLATHYGIPGVYGERFRRMEFNDGVRGGLLGQASLLMVTSYPDRTSPVVRGFWVLDNLLGMKPPPPPPNVPDLETRTPEGRSLSVREQLENHRRNPACAVCHVRMDPLGFALENFDGVGQWRAQADGHPIDTTAVFPDGTRFEGVQGLRALLLGHRDDFVRTFVTKMLTYAMGRRAEYYDYASIRQIVRDASANDYRWSDIILEVVKSPSFQMRSTP